MSRQARTPEYTAWSNMIQRCTNPKHPKYKNYGARGIAVCERWRTFANFLEDMGIRPVGLTIERKDNDKGYSPENCKWATQDEQHRNMTRPGRNSSGRTGVTWEQFTECWRATITINRKMVSLGRYHSLEEAITARRQGEIKYGF